MKHSFKFYVTTISLLIIFAQMAADLYLPAIPVMTKVFHTTIDNIQLTMFCYTIGYLLGALYYGPLSDRIGRRKSILISLLICILGSVVCITAHSLIQVFIGRVIQGLGFGGINSMGRTMVKDVSRDLTQMVTAGMYFNMFWALGIALSPCFGGYILQYFGWQAEFITLLGLGIILFVFCYFILDETNQQRMNTPITKVFADYRQILTTPRYVLYAASSASAYCMLLAYLTYAPHVFMLELHLNATQFGYTNLLLGSGILCGTFANGLLARKFKLDRLIGAGAGIILVVGVIYLVCGYLHFINLLILILPMFCFGFGLLFILPNTSSCAVAMFKRMAGAAAATFTFVQMIGGSCGSMLISLSKENNQLPLGIIFIIFASIIYILARILCNSKPYDIQS